MGKRCLVLREFHCTGRKNRRDRLLYCAPISTEAVSKAATATTFAYGDRRKYFFELVSNTGMHVLCEPSPAAHIHEAGIIPYEYRTSFVVVFHVARRVSRRISRPAAGNHRGHR